MRAYCMEYPPQQHHEYIDCLTGGGN